MLSSLEDPDLNASTWACFAMTLITAIVVLSGFFGRTTFPADNSRSEAPYWNGHRSYKATLEQRVIPGQLPGPADIWAGGEPKSIIIEAPYKQRTRFVVELFDSHKTMPPLIQVLSEGREIAILKVTPGNSAPKSKWITGGKPSTISFEVSSKHLSGEKPLITLKSIEGSWAAISRITASPLPGRWEYFISFISLAIFAFALARNYKKLNRDEATNFFRKWVSNILLALFFLSIWFLYVRDEDIYMAWNGYTPITYVYQSYHPQILAKDFFNGTQLFDTSIFMRIYKYLYTYFGVKPESLIPFVVGFQLAVMILALVTLTRTLIRDSSPLRDLSPLLPVVVVCLAMGSKAMNLSLAGYAKPTPLQGLTTYYNLSDALVLFAIIFIVKNRPVLSLVTLAVSFCVYPTTALICGVFIAASLLSDPKGNFSPSLLKGAVLLVAITGLWMVSNYSFEAVAGKGVTSEQYYKYTLWGSFHLYPVDRGGFTVKHHYMFMPFLSFMLLAFHYLKLRSPLDATDRKIAAGMAGLIALTLAGVLISYFKPNVTLVKLSLHRSSELLVALGFIYVINGLVNEILQGPPWRRAVAVAVISSVFIFRFNGYPLAYSLVLVIPALHRPSSRSALSTTMSVFVYLWLAFIGSVIACYAITGVYETYGSRMMLDKYFGGYMLFMISVCAFIFFTFADRWAKARARTTYAGLGVAAVMILSITWTHDNAAPYKDPWKDKAASYMDVQVWAKTSTPEESLFMPDPGVFLGWRDFSLRSSFGSLHEWLLIGWVYTSDRDTFVEGTNRFAEFSVNGDLEPMILPGGFTPVYRKVVERFYTFGDDWRNKIAHKYGIDYFVLFKGKMEKWGFVSSLKTVYENRYFAVLKAG